MGAGVWAAKEAAPAPQRMRAATRRPISSSSLDGVLIGLLKSVDGGAISAEVVQENGERGRTKKHIAGVKYEDFTIQLGPGTHKLVHAVDQRTRWAERGDCERSGEIKAADPLGNVKTLTTFEDALITEIGFPALDASSKDAAYLTLKFAPEVDHGEHAGRARSRASSTRRRRSGSRATSGSSSANLPTASASAKIDAFTIKQTS